MVVRINGNFYDDEMPKEDSHCNCLPVILLDSVVKLCRNYYLQVFLEDCKYLLKENEMTKFIY